MIKAAFFDIDGTLVSFKTHRMDEGTKRAIASLRQKGIKTFIATGRSEFLIDNVDMSLFDGVMSVNGQLIRDSGGILHKNPIPDGDIRAAIDHALRTGITTMFEGVDFLLINELNDNACFVREQANTPFPPSGDIREAAGKEVVQITFFGDPEQEREILGLMPSCEGTRWSAKLTDIMISGGGKHVGIEKTLAHYGFSPEECIAFGDGDNDITMLMAAGIGVAMGNATEEVKSAADFVTTSVDEDGIRHALHHYGII